MRNIHLLSNLSKAFVLVCGVMGGVWAEDASPDVPLSHPVYTLLDRFDARGWLVVSDTRPLTRAQVAHMLGKVQGLAMSAIERGLVDRYTAELAERSAFKREPRWVWRDSVASVTVEPVFRQQVIARRGDSFLNETVSQTHVGGTVRGRFHDFGFRLRHFEAREWSNQLRLRREDVLVRPVEDVQLKGKKADFRESVFQLAWANAWLRLDAGKGALDWGPGRSGNLLLTNGAPSYGLFRLQVSHGRVRYTHVAASLHARPGLIDTTRRWIDNGHVRIFLRRKRLAAHRLEIEFSKVRIGLHEAVIYGDRGFEPLYVLPVSVFVGVQNHLENRDNLMIGADVSVRPIAGLELYGAWFFDDMVKFNFDAFANKFAFQVGLFWVDPVGLADTDVRAEYVRVEPFVYSHNFDINTVEHYDALLGYPTGPNADRWFVRVTHQFAPWLNASVIFDRERQGKNSVQADGSFLNVGGDAQLGRRLDDLRTRDFMSGDVERRTKIGGSAMIEPVRNWMLRLVYQRVSGKNIQLVPGGRGNAVGSVWSAAVDVHF